MNFSQRIGLEQEKKPLQLDFMDDGLRMGLHNAIRRYEHFYSVQLGSLSGVYHKIWVYFMEQDSDEMNPYNMLTRIQVDIKAYFMGLAWNKVYDYIEFYTNHADRQQELEDFINQILEKNNSAYRFVEGIIAPITNEQELTEVVEACHTGQKAIDYHMKKAIEIFSDKNTKDYPNTIKEAITAVEAAVNIVNGSEGKTLGDALKQLDKKKKLQGTLKIAFDKLYGYTCDKETGIRHALINDAKCPPDFADAKFMLVACSAFVNYLLQKNT